MPYQLDSLALGRKLNVTMLLWTFFHIATRFFIFRTVVKLSKYARKNISSRGPINNARSIRKCKRNIGGSVFCPMLSASPDKFKCYAAHDSRYCARAFALLKETRYTCNLRSVYVNPTRGRGQHIGQQRMRHAPIIRRSICRAGRGAIGDDDFISFTFIT